MLEVVPILVVPVVGLRVIPVPVPVGDMLLPGVMLLIADVPPTVVPTIGAAVVGAIVPLVWAGPLLPGLGILELPGERVTGVLLGEEGCAWVALTMRSPNCSVVVSRPSVLMGSSNGCDRRDGC